MQSKRSRQRASSSETSPASSAMRRRAPKMQSTPTYLLQKEERGKLLEEVAVLEDQLEALRVQAGLPSREFTAAIEETRAQSFGLEQRIVANSLRLGRLHSCVTNKLLSPPVAPLSSHVHLPRDMHERRAILRSLKLTKLQRAEQFATNRFYHLDSCREYLKEERYTGSDGLFHCDRFEINQFSNFTSAQQLYDALLYFHSTMEIAVTDMIGQLTLREDTEETEPSIWNHRIVTTSEDVGCVEELNVVGFAQFYETHGVITVETVDGDDLYPYRPQERTRKDSQTVHVACEAVDAETNRKVVLLKSCTLTTELKPGFPLPASVEKKLNQHASRWSTVFVKYLKEYSVSTAAQ